MHRDPEPGRQTPCFSTERLQLAVYLHATEALGFLGCQPSSDGKIQFVFSDPDGLGPEKELEFDRGAQVSATRLFASQKFLRRKMTEEVNKRNTGVYDRKRK